jgi:hypothetical protein
MSHTELSLCRNRTNEDGMAPVQSEPKLSLSEVETLQVEALSDRAAMSLINANVAAPINVALALNVLSDGSTAFANAQQLAPIGQGI